MRDKNKIPDSCLQCYIHHRQQLVAHLTRLGGCRALAEDLAQDAWLKLAQVMPGQSLDNPKAYLFRIATNLLRDALRHRALVGAGDEAPLELIEAVQADPCGLVEHQCALRCVLRQLDDLPPRCRQVFELARLEGLSQAEIAERLGISVNTVIAQLAKARQGWSARNFQAARALVVRELLRQRAEALGLSLLDAEGREDDRTLASLLERELQVPEPDDAACRRFFEHHRERFAEPLLLRVRHILLPAAPDDARARDAQYRLGQKLLRQLQAAPARFTELAQRHSACPSKEDGGALGWLAPGQTVPELDRALRHLAIGLHERPLASRYGWHLVSVDERREERPLPYEQVAERVRHSLREQATRRALRHYLLALEEEIGVEGLRLDADADGALMR